MARPSPWQLKLENYPYCQEVPTRYSDLDVMGHINNVAIAGLFETGRVSLNHQLKTHPSELGVRWLVAAVHINYLEEMQFPQPVIIASGFSGIGNSSWRVLSGAFQEGLCCATCETVIVMHGPEGRRRVSEDMRAQMEPLFLRETLSD
jgi:acyl-CoA thioester hydrolase